MGVRVGGGEGFRIWPIELEDLSIRCGVALDVGGIALKTGEDFEHVAKKPEALVSRGGAGVRIRVLQIGEKQKAISVPPDFHGASLEAGLRRFSPVLAEAETGRLREKLIRLGECDRLSRGEAWAGQGLPGMSVGI